MGLSDLRELFLLRTGVARRLDVALAGRPRPAELGRVGVIGSDPIRVLVAGGGLAACYGVERAEDGFGGALARHLSEALHRGVLIDHRARPGLTMRETIALLGNAGAHTYDLVVWCPTFTELPRTVRLGRWLVELRRVMDRLIETGDRRTSYLLLGFPLIADEGVLEQIASTFVHRVNARIARVASEFPRTAFSYPPPAVGIGHALDRDYYDACAVQILPAVVAQLRLNRTRITD